MRPLRVRCEAPARCDSGTAQVRRVFRGETRGFRSFQTDVETILISSLTQLILAAARAAPWGRRQAPGRSRGLNDSAWVGITLAIFTIMLKSKIAPPSNCDDGSWRAGPLANRCPDLARPGDKRASVAFLEHAARHFARIDQRPDAAL